MAMVASTVSGVPWSLTAHRWDIVENNLLQRKADHACFFRCISEKTRELALERGVSVGKTLVLHLGVRLPEVALSSTDNSSQGEKFVVLCPAAFVKRKGHRYLVEALKFLPDQVELWLAGEGELRGEIEKQVKQLGLKSRVRIMGFLSHEKLLALYRERRVDLVALPSMNLGDGLNEGIPVSLMEAMSYGLPVVSTSTGGIPELLRDGAGVLVSDKDPMALAEAIATLYRERAYAKAVGEKGKRRVEKEFSAEAVVEELIKLWQGCV
ncbi:glycosyltransferase family 4 protein [Oceanithermus desulfurans]|uniref:Glycosyltransferase involved in cell wall biosynthesis n=1 Tax=Oceanithermus desulfurans TaxID=227924 RepID=A0ABR6P376_9DEIN|nr:glycosyltransferase family 4 protein [Oceanithermus desulfurans]MBB6030467.1 glycosyltransferase involved in cell wall biosynthesis [Oceanithermus desulfurans]